PQLRHRRGELAVPFGVYRNTVARVGDWSGADDWQSDGSAGVLLRRAHYPAVWRVSAADRRDVAQRAGEPDWSAGADGALARADGVKLDLLRREQCGDQRSDSARIH